MRASLLWVLLFGCAGGNQGSRMAPEPASRIPRGSIVDDDREVLDTVARHLWGSDLAQLSPRPAMPSVCVPLFGGRQRALPDGWRAAKEDLCLHAARLERLPTLEGGELRVSFVSGESTGRIYHLSVPGYGPARATAVVEVSFDCTLCGWGKLILLDRDTAGWRVADAISTWES